MAKIKVFQVSENKSSYLYFCKGCNEEHAFGLEKHHFNMNLESPTVTPSLWLNWVPDRNCHSYITNGVIEYLPDCWHELRGQTIELPEIEKED